MVVGMIITAVLSLILGLIITYIISIAILLTYLGGLVFVFYKIKDLNKLILLRIHFNLALVLRNENERLFKYYGIRARPGNLSRWIEFHAISTVPLYAQHR